VTGVPDWHPQPPVLQLGAALQAGAQVGAHVGAQGEYTVVATGLGLPNIPRQHPQPLAAIINVATVKNASDFFMAGSFRAVSNSLRAQEWGEGMSSPTAKSEPRTVPRRTVHQSIAPNVDQSKHEVAFLPHFRPVTSSVAFPNRDSRCNRIDPCD
jgi:hypothetical protein